MLGSEDNIGDEIVMDKTPIEISFPVNDLNNLAAREGAGGPSKKYFRPIYFIHKWWARRLGSVFRTIILYSLLDKNTKYLNGTHNKWEYIDWNSLKKYDLFNNYFIEDINLGGKVILDPFMGGGTTIVESLKLGCKVIGSDLNPVAWFLVKKEIESVSIEKLKSIINKFENDVSKEILKYYVTRCPHCKKEAEVIYYFWVKEISCLNCKSNIDMFRNYVVAYGKRKNEGTSVLCPKCGEIFSTKEQRLTTCPNCTNNFDYTLGQVEKGHYTCSNCGQKEDIIGNIKRNGKPKERLFGVYYYCKYCRKKEYKKSDDFDFSLIKTAEAEYDTKEADLIFPKQQIPMGYNTKQIINYGYLKWSDLFNKRMLLTISKLISKINEIDDENIKELLTITLSTSLEYYNLLCDYNQKGNFIFNLFKTHAYHSCNTPVENNLFGSTYGFGTYSNFLTQLVKAKEYNSHPYEVFYRGEQKIVKDSNVTIKADIAKDFKGLSESNALLFQGDSSYLELPDKSVDAVITDPPYFDNVMYSELADFYYVWLREALKNKYLQFKAELTPKSTEVIKNSARDKSTEDFIEGLSAVFKESNRVLKDEGPLVFTFHHKETMAWGAVLSSVLNSSFYISAIYPIRAEMSTSQSIREKASVEYDMIIVCRKRQEHPEEKSWRSIENELYTRVEEEIKKLEKENKLLSKEDIFIITVGKCLELYSKNYPNVMKDGNPLPVQEAVDSIRDIVDSQIMQTRVNQIAIELDVPTAIYLSFLAKVGSVSFEKLNKQLQQRNINMAEFLKEELVEKEGNSLLVLTAMERVEIILNKKFTSLKSIDKAHYLFYLYKKGNLDKDMYDWIDDKAIQTLFYLADITGDEDYRKLAVYVEKHRTQKQLGGIVK